MFPDPVSPLTFSLAMPTSAEGGWRDALVRIGAFTHDEFSPDNMETLGVFGGYCYLNAAVTRILGERAPGLSAQAMDDLFFGAQPGIPPYEPAPGDQNEERTAAIDGALAALGALRIDGIHTTRDLHRRILEDPGFRSGRYDVDTLATSGLLAGELG